MAYSNPRAGGIIALTIDEGDSLIAARLTDGHQDIILASRDGKSIRFPEENCRPMGRTARGVRGMSLENNDQVIGMQVVTDATSASLVTVTENGYGKRTDIGEYRVQSRGGKGIITIKTSERNGKVVDIKLVDDSQDLMFITDQGKLLRTSVGNIRVIGRNTQGVRFMVLEESERIVAVAQLAEKDEDDGGDSEAEETAFEGGEAPPAE